MNFPKSVEAYEDECAAVASWLSPDKWLDQHEFDKLSSAWRRDKSRKVKVYGYTDETIVAPMWGDLNLAILQELQAAGLVETKVENEVVSYRANWPVCT